MLGSNLSHAFPAADAALAQATPPLAPVVLLILCVAAGVGTVLLLPSRMEPALRKIGGVVLLAAGLILAALLVRWTAGTAAGAGMGTYFWIFATIALVGAIRVITHTKPVYSALYFVLTVFASAGLFLLLWAEFMAAALVLIYAGAILVTYVFVIMLAAEASSPATGVARLSETDTVSRDPVLASAVGFALMGVILFVIFDKAQAVERAGLGAGAAARPRVGGPVQELGAYLFERHIVSLELAGLILTVAMIGAIVIARKRVIVVQEAEPSGAPPQTTGAAGELVLGPSTPVDDNPHSIPVYGTTNPRQKEYPET